LSSDFIFSFILDKNFKMLIIFKVCFTGKVNSESDFNEISMEKLNKNYELKKTA